MIRLAHAGARIGGGARLAARARGLRGSGRVVAGDVDGHPHPVLDLLDEGLGQARLGDLLEDPLDAGAQGLQKALELLKTKKQKKLIITYFNHINREVLPLKVENLLEEAKVSNAVLKSVVEKGILEIYYLQKDRVSFADSDVFAKKTLNNIQKNVW